MTKHDEMVRSYLRWKQRQLQFDRKHCIKVTYKGLTLRFTKPLGDPDKLTKAKEYLQKVVETLYHEADEHMKKVLTTGYSVIQTNGVPNGDTTPCASNAV